MKARPQQLRHPQTALLQDSRPELAHFFAKQPVPETKTSWATLVLIQEIGPWLELVWLQRLFAQQAEQHDWDVRRLKLPLMPAAIGLRCQLFELARVVGWLCCFERVLR
jgi:hypothetical protein